MSNHRNIIGLYTRIFQLAAFSFAVTALSSCSAVEKVANVEHVASLKKAQIAFNEAAEKEIDLKSAATSIDDMTSEMEQIKNSYNGVNETVLILIENQRAELQRDTMLGQAYTLKALTEWKLENSQQALSTLDEAENSGVFFHPRDKALMAALPSIIQGEDAIQLMDEKNSTFNVLSNQLEESVGGFNNAISSNPEMDNSRLYLMTSQLGVMKNWNDLINDHRSYVTDSPAPALLRQTQDKWCDNYLKDIWSNYSTEVNRVNTANACQVYNNFFDLIGPDGCSTIQTQKLNCADL